MCHVRIRQLRLFKFGLRTCVAKRRVCGELWKFWRSRVSNLFEYSGFRMFSNARVFESLVPVLNVCTYRGHFGTKIDLETFTSTPPCSLRCFLCFQPADREPVACITVELDRCIEVLARQSRLGWMFHPRRSRRYFATAFGSRCCITVGLMRTCPIFFDHLLRKCQISLTGVWGPSGVGDSPSGLEPMKSLQPQNPPAEAPCLRGHRKQLLQLHARA